MNRLNLLSWLNIASRLGTNFGLVYFVSAYGGANAVSLWLLSVTLVATLATLDALLAQYFIRALIESLATVSAEPLLSMQSRVYWSLAAVFAVAGGIFLKGLNTEFTLTAALLLGVLTGMRRFEARTKAVANLHSLQILEALIAAGTFAGCLVALRLSHSVEWTVVCYLALNIFATSAKYLILGRRAYHERGLESGTTRTCEINGPSTRWARLRDTVLISSGGALSVNIGLLVVGTVMDPHRAAALLLSYRVLMVICEFGSAPVSTRIPEYSRLAVVEGVPQTRVAFRSSRNISLALVAAGVGVFAIGGPVLTGSVPSAFAILPRPLLVLGALAWIIERYNTLSAQFLLCCMEFGHASLYSAFLGSYAVGVVLAAVMHSTELFILAQLLSHAIMAPGIRRFTARPVVQSPVATG